MAARRLLKIARLSTAFSFFRGLNARTRSSSRFFSVHQFLHGAVLDVELYMRIGVEKGDERLGHDVAEGERYADVQFACKHFLQIVHVVYTGFGRIDRILGIRSQFLARLCEVNLMRIALEERQTYLLFQMRNLL